MLPAKQPLYVKAAYVLLLICLILFLLYIGQEIIIPIVLSAFFTILLNPVVVFLNRKGVNRNIAIGLAVTTAFMLLSGVIYFIVSQFSMFVEILPELEKKAEELLRNCVSWAARNMDIEKDTLLKWLEQGKAELISNSSLFIGTTLTTISGLLFLVVIIPIYTLMMLYYEPLFMGFIQQLLSRNEYPEAGAVITETKVVLQSYLTGLLIEAVLVAVLNSAGLLLIGVEYAILWGIIGAILNIIPYIGIIIAVIFPVMLAVLSADSYSVLLVFLLYGTVQFIDNNIIVPKIVASRVKINAIVSIVVVLLGGALWGVSGMFLSIPIIAVCKILFDHSKTLGPYGYLIGDSMPSGKLSIRKWLSARKPKNNAT